MKKVLNVFMLLSLFCLSFAVYAQDKEEDTEAPPKVAQEEDKDKPDGNEVVSASGGKNVDPCGTYSGSYTEDADGNSTVPGGTTVN